MERIRLGVDSSRNQYAQGRPERMASASGRTAFDQQLASVQTAKLSERIDRALAQVEALGKQLAQSLSLPELKRYRQAISALLKDLTDHMVDVRSQTDWDSQSWEQRTLVTIQRVDEELEQLTALVLSQEQDRLAILEKIGEIKGLLVDIRL